MPIAHKPGRPQFAHSVSGSRRGNTMAAASAAATVAAAAAIEAECSDSAISSQMQLEDRKFFRYFRMTKPQFNLLFDKIKSKILKRNQQNHLAPKEKLAICLSYLATGDSVPELSNQYEISTGVIKRSIIECCSAINDKLGEEVMPVMKAQDWRNMSELFWDTWNFPNCIGALEGKRVAINGDAITMLGLIDANYRFISVDIGLYDKAEDGGIFPNSKLGKSLEENTMNIPKEDHLPGTDVALPYVILGSESFPLKTYLMRPYHASHAAVDETKDNFNQRLISAREAADQTLKMLVRRFNVYNGRIEMNQEDATKIVLTTCILHNYINNYINKEQFGDEELEEVTEEKLKLYRLRRFRTNQYMEAEMSAGNVRDSYASYFCSPVGRIKWTE